MKKFALVTSGFFYLRSYKRMVSFRKGLSKFYGKKVLKLKSYREFKCFKNILFKTNLNRFLGYGINFFSAKNYGLTETGGFLKIYYASLISLAPVFTSFYFLENYIFLKNRLTLATVFFQGSFGITKAVNLATALCTKSNVLPFVAKNFFKRQFIYSNNFFQLLGQNRFHQNRNFWYQSKFNYKFIITGFSKKYFKFLFCQRFLNGKVVNRINQFYPYTSNKQLSSFYIKTVASQFASKYSKLEVVPSNIQF